ncbi:hypothetical protein [Sediminicurvatus halobius]|uniref:DUF1440 domain-containing protein n=1 Tax=Sediminicurvatus halobius TaxID=2182432 RepID=A0A2U2MW60_9GAMM|nr:hypothetical protein [Spiribacter halobius]PWG61090.1 hypothetical protein DEM34_18195 [Spiribacter halobius]UEX79679.1 hypothetical protein LMH63_08555 [Spiribacter halobius]
MNARPQVIVRGLGLGIANGALLSLIMVPAFVAGLPPMPKPPSLAFAEALFGEGLPMPVGLLFHLAYVTFWSAVWVVWDYPRLRLSTAAALAALLWVVALVVFFPINGWGMLGLGVSPALIPGALVPHALFAVFLWALGRLLIRRQRGAG